MPYLHLLSYLSGNQLNRNHTQMSLDTLSDTNESKFFQSFFDSSLFFGGRNLLLKIHRDKTTNQTNYIKKFTDEFFIRFKLAKEIS